MEKIEILKKELNRIDGQLREEIRKHIISFLEREHTDFFDFAGDREAWDMMRTRFVPAVVYDGGKAGFDGKSLTEVSGVGKNTDGTVFVSVMEEAKYSLERVWYIDEWIGIDDSVSFFEKYRKE